MMKGEYVRRLSVFTRMHRGAGSVSAVRRRYETDTFRSTVHAVAPRARLQKEVGSKPQAKRPKAKDQGLVLGPRFPRHGLVDRFRGFHLTSEFRIGQALADDLTDADIEALRIGHLAIIEAERLLVDIAEQVERLDTDISAMQLSLNQAPEILHAVSVNVAIGVFDGVINDLMFEALVQSVVGQQFIGKDRSARLNVLADMTLKFGFATILYVHHTYVSATFKHPEHYLFILATGAADDARTLALVHVSCFAADESFVDLDFARQLATILALLRESDPVKHEPRGFLGHVQRPCDLAGANAVLAIENEPHRRQPLVQTERRVFKDRSNLDGELPFRMSCAALPAQLILKETDFIGTAGRTHNAVLPLRPTSDKVVQAVLLIREIQDRFLQALWFLGFHDSILRRNRGLRKYIIARI
jgi:hypothetical protein